MGNPAWSTDDLNWTILTGAYRMGGRPRSKEEGQIKLETDSGADFVYPLFSREIREIVFRCTDTQLDTHEALHDYANGEENPFYFSLLGDGSDSIYMKKQPGFDPVELESPGGDEAMFDYVLYLRTYIP